MMVVFKKVLSCIRDTYWSTLTDFLNGGISETKDEQNVDNWLRNMWWVIYYSLPTFILKNFNTQIKRLMEL